jgi:retron-type reverse transcriptase
MSLKSKPEELLTPAASDRGSYERLTKTKDEEIIINKAGRSTYRDKKSVLRAEATPGVVTHAAEGTPQGGPISCVLANIYLHYSLDLWFERKFKPQSRGEAHLVRFVDDFVASFQYLTDAEAFQKQLRERFARFNL